MVKAIISSPLVRKVATTVMFTTAVVGANATNLMKNNQTTAVTQTEVMSKEASEALKVRNAGAEIQKVEHNKKMDRLLLETCDNHRDSKSVKSNADAVYKVFGTYGAMIELQRSLDDYYIEQMFDTYKSHYSMDSKECDIAEQIFSHFQGWKDNVYYTELFRDELKMYDKTKLPNADECIAAIDNHVNNKEFFNDTDRDLYHEFSKKFISKQKETNSVQAKSDLLAYKVHLLNSLAFSNYFLQEKKMPEENLFVVNFGYDFINGKGVVKP